MIPERIGQFEIKHLLGSGGFGHVYAAVDTDLGRWVAIKALRAEAGSNPAMVERFRAEGVSLARLNHANITTLYGLQRHGQEIFLIMELVEGQTLDKMLAGGHRFDVTELRAVVAQVSAGLGYAHSSGVIHRDIKPSNLMLTARGLLKIMDFGIARIRGTQRLTREGLLGTYAYLAPEQFRGAEGSERSDLYSLACLVFEMLSGSIPFEASSEAEMMRGHMELPPPPLKDKLPDIDPEMDAALQRALAKRPEDRFETVEAFASALGCDAIAPQSAAVLSQRIAHRLGPRPTRISQPIAELEPEMAVDRPRTGSSEAAHRVRSGASKRSRLFAPVASACAAALLMGGAAVFWLTMPRSSTTVLATNAPAMAPIAVGADTESSRVNRAQQLLDANRGGEAESLLVTSARRNFVPAMVKLARLYNPNLNGRPLGFEPSAARSARYYRDAIETGGDVTDPEVRREREDLRSYLKNRSKDGDTDAAITLKTFMP